MDEYNDAKKKALRAEYVARINRVIDYIEANLEDELSLRSLAKVANFSAYHFHRIFKGIVGETLNQFIQRRRIEKAASMLIGNPAKPITDIAFDCGFSQHTFSLGRRRKSQSTSAADASKLRHRRAGDASGTS